MLAALAASAEAQDRGPSYTLFGTPGLLEMPSAESAPRSELGTTLSYSETAGYKTTFTFQLSDRLSGSFRYSILDQYTTTTAGRDTPNIAETRDRSFDLQYRLSDETRYLPAVAVGLRDFLGTGRFSSEYIVASKSVGPKLIVTGGLGWGRMGTQNGFDNPLGKIDPAFETRPVYVERIFADEPGEGTGGQLSVDQWFRGDAALFGGLEYQATPDFGVKLEYSSIAYDPDPFTPAVDYESPWNVGISWRPAPGTELSLAYMYGTTIAAGATFTLNPEKREGGSGLDPAPAPVGVRSADQRAARTWDQTKQPEPAVRSVLTQLLKVEGINLVGLQITDRTARLRYENTRYRSEAQAMGRAARMMTRTIPQSVETFILEPVQRGIPISQVSLSRSQLESVENTVGATEATLAAAQFNQAGDAAGLVMQPNDEPKFRWGVGPYTDFIFFGPGQAVRSDYGLQARAEYQLTPNLVFAGHFKQSVRGDQQRRPFIRGANNYPNVRTDKSYYGKHGGPVIEALTASYTNRLAPAVYGRVTAGYLEKMYGGVSTEVLYAPVASRLALGAEVNYVAKRDQDMGFGFAEYQNVRRDGRVVRIEDGDFDTVTGYLSAYYDIGRGFHAQVDVGRYLAGDWGASFSLNREFENGWQVGSYFTLTDMPFDDFGEGSFDKGIHVSIPYDFFIGTPTRRTIGTTLRSLQRDGGARLDLDNRLYETVRDGRRQELGETWGRFWR